jgi:hypothetical protein
MIGFHEGRSDICEAPSLTGQGVRQASPVERRCITIYLKANLIDDWSGMVDHARRMAAFGAMRSNG